MKTIPQPFFNSWPPVGYIDKQTKASIPSKGNLSNFLSRFFT